MGDSATFLILPYVVFSFFIGYLGRHKTIGNLKAYAILVIISLTLTPLIGLIFLLTAKVENPWEEEQKKMEQLFKCNYCGWKFDHKFEVCPHCGKPASEEI